MLAVPSLKPSRLRAVTCLVEVEEVRPNPSCAQRIATVPNPIRARLRIACTATCGSWAQAWTHRSPLLRSGSRLSAGKCGSSRSCGGLAVREAEPVLAVLLEEGRAEPEGQGQAGGVQSEGLPGVGGRGVVRRDGGLADRAAGRHLARGLGPALQQRDQLLAGVGGDVERGEVQPVLGGSGDPRLVSSVEVVRRLVDARVDTLGAVRALPVGEPADPRSPGRDRARAGDSEEPPAGERALGGSRGGRGSVTE